MQPYSRLHKAMSLIISLSLLLQSLAIPIALALTPATASAFESNQADSLTGRATVEPPVLAQPITISRVQSSYQTGGEVVISFTVSNNQPQSLFPDVTGSPTITDTVDILADFVVADDGNTVRDVTVATTLTADAIYVDSSTAPVQVGSTFTWDLGHIPPQASQLLTVTVQGPAAAADFIDLDGGATAQGDLWDLTVTDSARPAVVVPDSLAAAYTQATVDADMFEADMLWKAAELTQDPLTLFNLVASFAYDPYKGSLRGTRGTLWGSAGNSLDQASLLIAMLRAAGVPARYRHGALDTTGAQAVLGSMFPPATGVAGSLPSGESLADPLNDPALIALAQDHWWVEAYLPGSGWTDLDPTYPGAGPGDAFATPAVDGTDQIAEIPDSLRHKVTIRLQVEQYQSFPLAGSNLTTFYPLTATLTTAELAARSITILHLVDTNNQGGMIYSTVTHSYVPLLHIGGREEMIEGDLFEDVLSNFPLSSTFTNAEWIIFDVQDTDGNVSSYTRVIKDLVGLDARIGGGTVILAQPADNAAFVQADDQLTTGFLPNAVPDWAAARQQGELLPTLVNVAQQSVYAQSIRDNEVVSAEDTAFAQKARFDLQMANAQLQASVVFNFGALADNNMADIGRGLLVKQYFSAPRLIGVGTLRNDEEQILNYTVDLRTTHAAAVVYPGQAADAAYTANWIKGISESTLEGIVLEQATGMVPVTTARLFEAMVAQDIAPQLITASDMALLATYDLRPSAYVYAAEALLEGKQLVIPSQPVLLDGELTLGWWEIDPVTGETISVMENGLHLSLVEYELTGMLIDAIIGVIRDKLMPNWNQIFFDAMVAVAGGIGGGANKAGFAGGAPDSWRYMQAPYCPHDNCGLEQFFVDGVSSLPITLPEMLFTYGQTDAAAPTASAQVFAGGGGGGAPAFTLSANPAGSTIDPNGTALFQADISANFNDTYTITVTAPDSWQVSIDGGGAVTAVPPIGSPSDDYAVLMVAQSTLHPDLFGTAVHTVTITALQDMALTISPEPNITLPSGVPTAGSAANDINDGQAELTGMAYTVNISNTSTVSHTFDIVISGQPADQVILNGVAGSTADAVTLPAGAVSQVGLYILPPAGSVPAPGTTYPVDVTVTAADEPGLSETAPALPTVPSVPFSQLTVNPTTIFATANSTTTFAIDLANVGNAAGSFPLAVTVPTTTWSVANLQSPVALNAGESQSQAVTLNVGDGSTGATYPLLVSGPVPSSDYAQTTQALVRLVSATTGTVFETADTIGSSCTLGNPGQASALAAGLETLALAMTDLEGSCDSGGCLLAYRDQVVDALNAVAGYAAPISPLVMADTALQTIAADMAGHTIDIDLQADLAAIGPAVTALEGEVCEISEHLPAASWSPAYEAALPGQAVSYTLSVANLGSVSTSYAITVSLPAGSSSFNDTLAPGETGHYDFLTSATTLGLYELTAEVAATGAGVNLSGIGAAASAGLNVVDKFVQVTVVTADPAFVDTGVSATNLSVDVANVANVARPATARTTVQAPGGAITYTADIPLTILVGAPQRYDLAALDTSGWAEGVYTITVNLLDGAGALIPDGSGYGFLAVGQALGISHSLLPDLVSPGTVTVTTVISSEILAGNIVTPTTFGPPARPVAPRLPTPGMKPAGLENLLFDEETAPADADPETAPESATGAPVAVGPSDVYLGPEADADETEPGERSAHTSLFAGGGITRTEEIDPGITYVGAWTFNSTQHASGGGYARADAAGEAFSYTFTGAWVNLGFIATNLGAQGEVFIDGVSQGTIDLYRREIVPVSYAYSGFITGTHTISVTHLGTTNPYASNDYFQLDYIDVWDGSAMADGTFEQDDARVLLSNGWDTISDTTASGGSYIREGFATAWFPFSGDSVTYQAVAYSGGGKVQVFIDGVFQTTLDLYNPLVSITRTLSFDGLGAGPHIMQVNDYRGNATVDTFTTPGTAPFFPPPPSTGFNRFEEDDPGFVFNGDPFMTTAQSWTRTDHIYYSESSDGQRIYSNAAGNTATFTFDGTWASVGFFVDKNSGMADIEIDGVSQGTVDLYSNEEDVASFSYDGLIAGSHTLTVTVLGTSNPLASNSYVSLDYVDTWDGTALATGWFEQTDARVLRSGGWTDVANANTSGGSYSEAVLHGEPTAWFPFTGDSVTYQAYDYFRADEVAIYIDETFQGYFDIRTGAAPTITHSFTGLGAGLHILKIRDYRNEPMLDAFSAPAITAPAPPPTPTVFTRYEEDEPVISYNGLPYTTTASTWNRADDTLRASGGQYIASSAPGDSVSFSFSGTWVQVGFLTDRSSGRAELFLDGVSQGPIDLYTRDPDVTAITFDGLADTTHTISLTLLGTTHPNAIGDQVMIDYFETWDGASLPAATYEDDHPSVYRSDNFDDWSVVSDGAASGGQYLEDAFQGDGTVWFPFTGDSITFLALANSSGDEVEITIDDNLMGAFNIYSGVPMTRAISFEGLGAGPHIMQVRHYKGYLNVDAFVVPGIAPFFQTPVYTGVVRYEESHPAVVYDGVDTFRQRANGWTVSETRPQVSGRWVASSSVVGSDVSLTFDGRWVNIGFRAINNAGQAEIFIDGISQGFVNLDNDAGEDVAVFQVGDLLTGTHTVSVVVVSGSVHFDYFDIWDGSADAGEMVNIHRGEDINRLHYSSGIVDQTNANAIEGDYAGTRLLNTNSNIWFTFVGDAFTFLGFSRANTTFVDLYVDGVLIDTVDVEYPFSEQTLTFHYTGFAPGPHEVRIHNGLYLRADAFQANPASLAPFNPQAEWYDTTPNGGSGSFGTPAGMLMGIAAGDLDGDGLVEIVAPSDTYTTGGFINSVFIFRGDGLDAGSGSPLIHRIDFPSMGIGVGREIIGSVALADLDGQPGSEIIIGSERGMYAFYNTGATYWFTDTFQAANTNATVATPAVGNLDLDAAPEIVINMFQTLVVYGADGSIEWSEAFVNEVGMPMLADMTGDGLLDIIVYDVGGEVRLYDYNYGTPQLLWQTPLSTTISIIRGGPALADVDGDGEPEIAIAHDGYLTVLDRNGAVVWSTELDPGAAGGVSVADLDGDGEIEIVTGMRYDDGIGVGRLYALNADGSILWERPAYDSTSANAQSVLDLDGDGVYEIAWNGAEYGFTIFNGADGEILFSEPLAESLTATDYPIFADVDGDGYAEVVVPSNDGLVVFGQDGVWGEARPLWNQHAYHITNINDDLTVPFSEPNSWDVHNTYRTQWPASVVLPVYDVVLTHTVGVTNVNVLTDTFSITPDVSTDPTYGWAYSQSWATPVMTRTFDSVLTDLQPGESRLAAQGTEVVYTLPSGSNQLTLPPMYVSAAHIIAVAPETQTAGAGGTVDYDVLLSNPGAGADTYALTVTGLPAAWLTLPLTATVPAGGALTATLTVAVPAGVDPQTLDFVVSVTNLGGGFDQAGAALTVIDALDVAISPAEQSAETGVSIDYTLTLTNFMATAQEYALASAGLAAVTLPPTMTVPANSAVSVVIQAVAGSDGPAPFTVSAANAGAADSDSAILNASGNWRVGVALDPTTVSSGPGTPAAFTLSVSNLGDVSDAYDLTVAVPAGWTYSLTANGTPIGAVTLPPAVFNTVDLELFVTPDVSAAPGSYPVIVTAESQSHPGITAVVTGTLDVLDRGVQIAITPDNITLNPTDSGLWQVTVTNTGSVSDSYWLTATGIVGLSGQLSDNPVVLDPGQSQTVQLTADVFGIALPQSYLFAVSAASQNDDRIVNQAIGTITFNGQEGVEVSWQPASRTVTETLTADFTLVVTNTGNVPTDFTFNLNMPGLSGQLPAGALRIPAHRSVVLPLTVTANGAGDYTIEGTATSTGASGSSSATLTVIFEGQPPTATAGANQAAAEGDVLQFNGSASDPDGTIADILWDFGDGNTATGTFTPTHIYADNGPFTVTLTVTDNSGLTDDDTLLVTVANANPTVVAGLNQNAVEGGTVALDPATFTDPGAADTHTATIDWGDGTVVSGTVDQGLDTVSGDHSYGDNGVFTVIVTVNDDDGGSDSDSFTVTVSNANPLVNAGADQAAAPAVEVCLDPATFSDAGADDTHTATVDWDDGTVEPGTVDQGADTVSACHTYAVTGEYTVTVTVLDDDGGSGNDSLEIVISEINYPLYLPIVKQP